MLKLGKLLFENLSKDYLSLVAAGIGFYFLLALLPAIAGIVSIYGLFADPADIAVQIQGMSQIMPHDVLTVISDQATKIASEPGGALSFSLLTSLVLTIYSTSKGMKAMIQGIGLAYEESLRRKTVSLTIMSFVLTFVMIIYFIVSMSLIAGIPAIVHFMRIPAPLSDLLLTLRWGVLMLLAVIGLETLYYFSPSHRTKRFMWFSYGSVAAAGLWLVGSVLFTIVVSNFYDFNKVYGSLGVGVALLFWFYLSALIILMGAEINSTLDKYFADRKPKAEPNVDTSVSMIQH